MNVAFADPIYQCIDAQGYRAISNIKISRTGTQCTLIDLGKSPTRPARPAPPASSKKAAKPSAAPSPSNFPKVAEKTQKSRDIDRKYILENELESEQKNLAQAKKELSEHDAARASDEKNAQKISAPDPKLASKVSLHQRNIDALEKELSKFR